MTAGNNDTLRVQLGAIEWGKLLVAGVLAIVSWSVTAYRFVDGIRDDLNGRLIVVEQKTSNEDRVERRLTTIETDIKSILEKMPRNP